MHPFFADRKSLAIYLLAWVALGILLAMVVLEPGTMAVAEAVLVTIPPTILFAFVCLAAWFPARSMPLDRTRTGALLPAHLLGAAVTSAIWLAMLRLSARGFDILAAGGGAVDAVDRRSPALAVTGALLYLLALSVHYLVLGLERSRAVERREIEVRMLAREAELKALKAQLDPHFLFNSLNSISSLCGSNPSSARTLTTLLAEFLRKSLRLGNAESITLSEELELAGSYLAVERIRFGSRLEFEQEVDEGARTCRVPPLLLQPLVENAVTHGIGQLLEGGIIRITARREGTGVQVMVENARDPDAPSPSGEGIGLANTRRRLSTFYGPPARMEIEREPALFRVSLTIPA